MPYLWITNKSEIQRFFGTDGTIQIVTSPSNPQDYAESDAIEWENYAVRFLCEWLSSGWNAHENITPSDTLKNLAAELTAAMIGIDKLVTQFGRSNVPAWILLRLTSVHQRVSSFYRNHAVADLGETPIKKRMTYEQAQLAALERDIQPHLTLLGTS